MKKCLTWKSLTCLVMLVAPGTASAADGERNAAGLPPASADRLPRWRGFNLLEKFHKDWNNGPFREEDFRLIHELGFNFVRLPMDYRIWADDDAGTRFREAPLKEIDQAVGWGEKYGIHVCLNFHRAPGYTVASPPEPRSLWTDPGAGQAFANHWAMFARRYKGVPSGRLSFNLVNEPADVPAAAYARVVRLAVEAIRKEDPNRLVICDGLSWGTRPVPELKGLRVAQATRGYTPMELTHYKASWVRGADRYPVPAWPVALAHGTLYGSGKRDLQKPMTLDGPFAGPARLVLHVDTVSSRARLLVDADGHTVFQKDFVAGPGEGEWKKAVLMKEWNTYQNVYDRDYEAGIPAGTRRVSVHVTDGDWVRLARLTLRREGRPDAALDLRSAWGQPPARLRLEDAPGGARLVGDAMQDRAWLRETAVEPWKKLQAEGVGVMVGEFGAHNQTPHAATLAWMEDCLKNWKEAGWGWALWNFRGSFGVLDSGRADVRTMDVHGHKLDRAMLELLQKY